MFDAFKAANGHTHDDNESYQHKHAMHHDGTDGHDHGYVANDIEQFPEGQDRHDGHNHEQYRERYHAMPRKHDHTHENNPSAIKQLHDGPGGHHHDDDGHDHKNHNENATEVEENKERNEDLRKFTLIISKLLFQLPQNSNIASRNRIGFKKMLCFVQDDFLEAQSLHS